MKACRLLKRVFLIVILAGVGLSCGNAQNLEREQGPYEPAEEVSPAVKEYLNDFDALSIPAEEKTAPIDSKASSLRLKKIEEKIQQVDAIKQEKSVQSKAIEHFQKGEALYKASKTKEANAEWMQAIELSKDPAWMKSTINETKRTHALELKNKKIIAQQDKKRKALEEKQKKKLERIRLKEEKKRKELVNFNKKPKKKFFLFGNKDSSSFIDLNKPINNKSKVTAPAAK